MSRYLVTGGAGFIGSHLVEELLRRGQHVRIVDNLSTGKRENVDAAVAAARNGIDAGFDGRSASFGQPEVLVGDLADPDVVQRAVKNVDIVLHQAAVPSVPLSVEDPIGSNRANLEGTLQLLVAARDARVKRVVFAASSAAYGDAPVLPKREESPTNPLSPYALQKLMGEQYLQLFTRLYGLDTVSIRYFNVFGPRQDPSSPYSGVISLFIKAVVNGRGLIIHGDGEQTRDFTYVANVVDGVLRAAHAPGVSGEVINVATGSRITLNDLLATLKRITGSDIEPTYGPPRVGDVRDSQADISKAERLLGYRPIVGLEEGLRRTVAWFSA
jgi:nucleoside-diphosphate-sugar epimerase